MSRTTKRMKIIQALIRRRLDAAGGMAIDNMYTSVLSKKYVDICGQCPDLST